MINNKKYRETIFRKIGISPFSKNENDFVNAMKYVDHMIAYILKNSPRPAYVGVGTPKVFFKKHGIDDQMYMVGTAVRYSKTGFDNHAVMIDNFENHYNLEYLMNNFQTHHEDDTVKKHMNVTYLPGLMQVKKHFNKKGNSAKTKYYQSIIEKIAKDSGREKEIMSWFHE
jgi:hypothetical protein